MLVGDAADAMPIFAGEGGNHAFVDGVELGARLADGSDENRIGDFYERMRETWRMAVDGLTGRRKGLGSC